VALSGIDSLLRIVSAPNEPAEAPLPGEWDEVETRLGFVLPSDYKAFIERFGSGHFDEFLWVLNPFSANEAIRFPDASERQLAILRWLRDGGEQLPYPIYPEPGGIVVWAETANGDCLYWITSEASPDEWSVTSNEARGQDWYDHPGPMSAFLADLLNRTIWVEFISSVFPPPNPTFHRSDDSGQPQALTSP
jgi:hypothetical protein